jgi:PhnB protein
MTRPQTIPDGYGTVTPWIIGRDTNGLMQFLHQAFDAVELSRMVQADGTIAHAEMRIGTSVVMMFDAPSDGRFWPDTPSFLRLYLDDADQSFARALEAGATPITSVTHLAFGDKVARVRDPFGNFWWLQTRVEQVDAAEMTRRWSDPSWAEAMAYVQGADFFGTP